MAHRIDADLEVTGGLALVGTMSSGSVPASLLTGTIAVVRSWAYTGGDVTSVAGSAVLTIGNNRVTYAMLVDMAQATFLMRAAGAGTGDPIAGTAAQAKTALAISTSDVSGLGTMATQNANNVAITGGTANFTLPVSMTSTAGTLYIENSSTSFNGDVLQLISATANGANWYAVRVYNNLGAAIAGWRGDGAVVAAVQVFAPNFVVGQLNKGTVGSTSSIDWRQGAYHTLQLTSATPLTVTFSNAPQGPGKLWIKVTAPASGTVPAITWPAAFKNSPPTTVTTLGRFNLLEVFYDGSGNYLYMSGALNIA